MNSTMNCQLKMDYECVQYLKVKRISTIHVIASLDQIGTRMGDCWGDLGVSGIGSDFDAG